MVLATRSPPFPHVKKQVWCLRNKEKKKWRKQELVAKDLPS